MEFLKKIYAKRGVSYMGFKLSFWLPVIPVEINPSRKDMTSSAEACLKLLITIHKMLILILNLDAKGGNSNKVLG